MRYLFLKTGSIHSNRSYRACKCKEMEYQNQVVVNDFSACFPLRISNSEMHMAKKCT